VRDGNIDTAQYLKHFGVYAYRREFLDIFTRMPTSDLENAEKLEQLRVLEAGYRIKVIISEQDSVGVDTQEDFDKVAAILGQRI
jgi:CMP-2-keto-3-deoxyoctulosonic acid synthetase